MNKHEFREIQKKLKLTNEGVSEAMDVELFTVQQWASGAWSIPKPMVKFLYILAKRDMEAVYMSGYGRGLNSGRKEGRLDIVENYTVGYKEGCEVGQRRGEKKRYGEDFIRGYKQGQADGLAEGRLDLSAEYTKGYDDGYKKGTDDGHKEKYANERKEGYAEGYIAAMKTMGIF